MSLASTCIHNYVYPTYRYAGRAGKNYEPCLVTRVILKVCVVYITLAVIFSPAERSSDRNMSGIPMGRARQ